MPFSEVPMEGNKLKLTIDYLKEGSRRFSNSR